MNFWDFCGVNFHLLDLKKKKKTHCNYKFKAKFNYIKRDFQPR